MNNRTTWYLFICAVILLFIRLGAMSVFQVAEARNVECAYEMHSRNDWIVPTFNGNLRTDKPALEYFAMITSFRLFGVSEGSARLFSSICGLLVIFGTYLFAKKHFNERTATWSAAILLASVHAIIQFRLATPDPYLIFTHAFSVFFFYEGWTSKKFKWYAWMYVMFGLGLLAKGPIGFLLPALGIFVFLLIKKQFTWKNIYLLHPWFGVLIIAIVSVPWYYLVHEKTNGAWTQGFFFEHNISRFEKAVDNHSGIFLLTFAFVIAGLFPFSVFFIRASQFIGKQLKSNEAVLYTTVSALIVVLFYCFSSTKLFNYTTPSYPFFAILLGYWISEIAETKDFKFLKWEFWFITLVSFSLPVGIFFWASKTEPLTSVNWLAYPLILIPLITLSAYFRRQKDNADLLLTIAGSYMAVSFLLFTIIFPAMDSQTSMRKNEEILTSGKVVVAYKNFNDAFVFTAKKTIPEIQNLQQLDSALKAHPRLLIVSKAFVSAELDSMKNLKLISKSRDVFSRQYSVIYEEIE
ncbi:phospholipid carrier-dependent glycosyltransferase [Pedobacter sp. HMF7647]|uniref:Phospholipid carrier-dependent glycosyltransferase n=1 Tax=Hufsiella arboris TaxID=2695275 RepID=A0A7K1Y9Y0_9SPHI|nr:glycosyltransferase family 39 protein [Hufsiella arboris]MXV51374.1 phospholipid carrier-dependent glycosyltransferase [Hufsiella arboris]